MSDDLSLITTPKEESGSDKLSELIAPEGEVYREAIKSGDIELPQIRIFTGPHADSDDDSGTLQHAASIVLKPHHDEASYRNALMEVAVCLPMFACMAVSLWYKTVNDNNGLMYQHFAHGIGGCFLDDEGESISMDEFNASNIDTETVIILEKFTKIPSDATYVESTIRTLRRRGHQVTTHIDLDTLYCP